MTIADIMHQVGQLNGWWIVPVAFISSMLIWR